MQYTKISQIAKGWSSYIWLVKDEQGQEFILKEVREKSPRKDLAHREGEMLLLANACGVGPAVAEVDYEKNCVVMEYVRGKKFLDWVMDDTFEKEVSVEQLYAFVKELYRQCNALDAAGISHNQLQVGKNILVVEKNKTFTPVIIDFEKATLKEIGSTKNVGQIMSMIFFNPEGAIARKVRNKLNLEL